MQGTRLVLSPHLSRVLIFPDCDKPRMPQMAVRSPFHALNLPYQKPGFSHRHSFIFSASLSSFRRSIASG